LAYAHQLLKFGIKPKDALHVASAVEGKADYFLTTEDKLLSGIKKSNILCFMNFVILMVLKILLLDDAHNQRVNTTHKSSADAPHLYACYPCRSLGTPLPLRPQGMPELPGNLSPV
jgi:hypothetical protein